MSRPWSSVPSQNVPPLATREPGGSRLSITSSCARSYGFCGEMSGAKIAASDHERRAAPEPKIATGLATKSLDDRAGTGLHVLAMRIGGAIDAHPLLSVSPHARIERRIEHVDRPG